MDIQYSHTHSAHTTPTPHTQHMHMQRPMMRRRRRRVFRVLSFVCTTASAASALASHCVFCCIVPSLRRSRRPVSVATIKRSSVPSHTTHYSTYAPRKRRDASPTVDTQHKHNPECSFADNMREIKLYNTHQLRSCAGSLGCMLAYHRRRTDDAAR